MRAIFASLPTDLIEQRKKSGADLRDEMWEGVLHVPPMATNPHQDFAGDLRDYLKHNWARPIKAKVYPEVNLASIGGWKTDYRIPDLLLLTRDRFHIDRTTHFEGAPSAVVEIHSPDDEAYEKLPFYEQLEVPEVWIIHRDTKEPEVYVLKRGKLQLQAAVDGWMQSPLTGLEMQANGKGKLVIRKIGDDTSREELPND
jgi:Uma2 family endonuclease